MRRRCYQNKGKNGLRGHFASVTRCVAFACIVALISLVSGPRWVPCQGAGGKNDGDEKPDEEKITAEFDKLVSQGRDAVNQGRFPVAIEVLNVAIALNPKSPTSYHLLGLAHAGQGNSDEAIRYLCGALQRAPANDDVRKNLAMALGKGFPVHTREETIQTLKDVYFEQCWQREMFTIDVAMETGTVTSKAYKAFCTSGLLFPSNIPQRDPLHSQIDVSDLPDAWRFNRVTYGYIQEGNEDEWTLRFRVYYVSPHLARGGRDYGPLSRSLCRIAMQVFAVVKDNMGAISPHEPEPVVNIWLCEKGEAGAQQPIQAPGSIYFYDINRERPWSEWMRQMVHEYGHLLLPAIGGFTNAPEPTASGEIGERLFLPWIRSSLDMRPDQVPLEDRKQIDDLVLAKTEESLKIFLQEGPESPLLVDAGEWGMHLLCGFCVWIARTHNAAFLRACLEQAKTAAGPTTIRAVDVRQAYQKLFPEYLAKGLTYRATLPVPRFTQIAADAERQGGLPLRQNDAAGYWVYLTEGKWTLLPRLECSGPGVLAVSWNGQGFEEHGLVITPGQEMAVSLEKITTGWRILRLQGKNLPTPVRLEALTFKRL